MTPEDAKAIRRGIEVAERQIADIDTRISQLKTLLEQRTHLQTYINHAKALLGEVPSLASILGPLGPTGPIESLRALTELRDDIGRRLTGKNDADRPLWREAAWVIARAQRPLTVPEIVDGMKSEGKQLTGENSTEVVRVALSRRPEVIENVGRGRYALKLWPAEWKTRERAPESALTTLTQNILGSGPFQEAMRALGEIKIPEVSKTR